MSQPDFDTALIAAAFRLAGEQGWPSVTIAAACREAGISLAEARGRFPGRSALLLRFGRLLDQAALAEVSDDGPVRERLFDLLMRRLDALQPHRAGVKSLLRSLPLDPPTALMLHAATRRSMSWMLQAAGVTARGVRGELQVQGLTALWYWVLRGWERDESEDLSATMAALDSALQRAEGVASWVNGTGSSVPPVLDEGAMAGGGSAAASEGWETEATGMSDAGAAAGLSPATGEGAPIDGATAGGAESGEPPADDTPLGDMPLPGPTV